MKKWRAVLLSTVISIRASSAIADAAPADVPRANRSPASTTRAATMAVNSPSDTTAASAATSSLEPYTAFAWAASTLNGTPHISPMIWADNRALPGIIARRLRALPIGRRVLFIWHAQNMIWGNQHDLIPLVNTTVASQPFQQSSSVSKTAVQGPWLDHGAADLAGWFGPWLDYLKKAGGTIDFLVTDAEVNLSMWSVQPAQIHAIGNDPRYSAVASNYHVTDLDGVGNLGRWDVCAAWNAAMNGTIAGYFRDAYRTPLLNRFPNAGSSEYNDVLLTAGVAPRARDLNGWVQPAPGPLFGSHQSPALYGQIRQLAIEGRNDGTNPDFTRDSLAIIAWQAGVARALAADASHPILPWFCFRSWRGDNAGTTPLAGTDYWQELVYQCMLSAGCVDCLFWDPAAPPGDLVAMDATLAKLQRATGNSRNLRPLTRDAVPFNAPVIISGATCDDGRDVYRITVMPGATSATIRLPQDVQPRTIPVPAGQAGIWLAVDHQNAPSK